MSKLYPFKRYAYPSISRYSYHAEFNEPSRIRENRCPTFWQIENLPEYDCLDIDCLADIYLFILGDRFWILYTNGPYDNPCEQFGANITFCDLDGVLIILMLADCIDC